MSSNEVPKFDKVLASIVALHNGEGLNFAFLFSVEQETSLDLLRALHEYLTKFLAKTDAESKAH
jgi:hypothetical protein